MNCFQTLGVVVFLITVMVMLTTVSVEKQSDAKLVTVTPASARDSAFSVADWIGVAAICTAFGLMTAGFVKWWKC